MNKLEDLRWVIIASEAEVIKWTKAFNDFDKNIRLEVGPNVSSPQTVDVLLLWNHLLTTALSLLVKLKLIT